MNHRRLSLDRHALSELPSVAFWLTVSWTALALVLAAPGAAAIRSFELSHAAILETHPPTIRTYARILDERNDPVRNLTDVSITATLGEGSLQLIRKAPFHANNDGVAYVFLIDISKSLSDQEFGLIQRALETWLIGLLPNDRAAVMAFGNQSRLVVDFSSDINELRNGVLALGPTDSKTVFFEALEDGLELARRRDPDLPGRRALIVLTDGRDEGSGWVAADILGKLRNDPVPIFAIGLSRIRDRAERDRYLQLLQRLSTNSGGAFFLGETKTIGDTYRAIRRTVEDVWTLDFACESCPRDGQTYRLQANLSDGNRVFSNGRALRLLAPIGVSSSRSRETVVRPMPSSNENEEVVEEVEGTPELEPASDSTARSWGPLLGLLGVLAGGGLLAFAIKRRKARVEQVDPIVPVSATPPKKAHHEIFTTPTGVVTSRPPRPWKLRMVRLVVVRGTKPGKQYTLTLLERARVGSRSTCECVLIGEPRVSAEQFELFQLDGNVLVRNLSPDNPTLLDGLPIEGQQPIQTEALVGTREFIVRVLFGEGRATTRS